MIDMSTDPDRRTTDQAHARLDMHIAVCAEQYKALYASLQRIEATLLAMQTDVHSRLTTISNRMWSWMTGVLGGTVVALSALTFYLLTKGPK